jgi:Rrf2 family transcriptional regulator, nitric oxide-sensitive transcriptional repressor
LRHIERISAFNQQSHIGGCPAERALVSKQGTSVLKVNRKVEYGLVALKHMFSKPRGQLTSVREICDHFGTPFDPVAHVMRILNAEGLVKSEQGAHGGYRLLENVLDVTFGDFIEIIEGHPLAFTECLREEDCRCSLMERCNILTPMHTLHHRLSTFLRSIKLSELLADGTMAALPREREDVVSA